MDVQNALKEIMEIPPMYRRDFIVDYIRKYLPKADAKKIVLRKNTDEFLCEMIERGHTDKWEILELIGKKRVEKYLDQINNEI